MTKPIREYAAGVGPAARWCDRIDRRVDAWRILPNVNHRGNAKTAVYAHGSTTTTRPAAECEDREREEKARAFQWYRLMRKTYPDTSNEKHVLRMIADHADIDTGTCCVKVSTICRETLLKPTAVKTAIRGLVELGIIERTNRIRARGGGKAANRYRILPSNPCEIG